MSVRAKFYVQSVAWGTVWQGDQNVPARIVKLEAVSSVTGPNPDEEDEDSIFGSATPSGSVDMIVVADGAGAWFQERIGRKVYLDFTDAA